MKTIIISAVVLICLAGCAGTSFDRLSSCFEAVTECTGEMQAMKGETVIQNRSIKIAEELLNGLPTSQ